MNQVGDPPQQQRRSSEEPGRSCEWDTRPKTTQVNCALATAAHAVGTQRGAHIGKGSQGGSAGWSPPATSPHQL